MTQQHSPDTIKRLTLDAYHYGIMLGFGLGLGGGCLVGAFVAWWVTKCTVCGVKLSDSGVNEVREVQEIPVTCCGDCVFQVIQSPRGVSECRHPKGRLEANIDASTDGAAPPDWCPLRTTHVEIRLEQS